MKLPLLLGILLVGQLEQQPIEESFLFGEPIVVDEAGAKMPVCGVDDAGEGPRG